MEGRREGRGRKGEREREWEKKNYMFTIRITIQYTSNGKLLSNVVILKKSSLLICIIEYMWNLLL